MFLGPGLAHCNEIPWSYTVLHTYPLPPVLGKYPDRGGSGFRSQSGRHTYAERHFYNYWLTYAYLLLAIAKWESHKTWGVKSGINREEFLQGCVPKGCLLTFTAAPYGNGSKCSRQEGSGPAGLPKSVEEVWRRELIVIQMWCRYVWLLYMRCSIARLFTWILVLSCGIGKEGCTCETWNGGTNSKLLGGPRQTRMIHGEGSWQEVQSDPRTRPW